ncbi:Protein DEL-8 [Aphelenchoides avenae]|nr:Protein DEL-8 [Aphelenchus avenae]
MNEPNKFHNDPDQQIIVYVGERKPHIAPFPRYYMYSGTWVKFRVTARHVQLFEEEEKCSSTNNNSSKDTCYVEKWLQSSVEDPLKCTYPYMDTLRSVDLPSCHPEVLVGNYSNSVESSNYTTHSCVLPCDRWEYTVAIDKTSLEDVRPKRTFPFKYRVDVSYNDLQYEHIQDVKTVSFFGLLSQIGGQLSLFLGSSILTLTQAVIMIVLVVKRYLKKVVIEPRKESWVTPRGGSTNDAELKL